MKELCHGDWVAARRMRLSFRAQDKTDDSFRFDLCIEEDVSPTKRPKSS
jgi:hypothetical protein